MKQPQPSFYNLAWRWHFYAGLFVAPFMILLALTGIVYLFKPQLDPWMYRDLMVVEAGAQRQSADTLLAKVRQAYPQGHISQYLPPLNAERSAQFVVHDGGRELNVFVDPYRAEVLGVQDGKRNLQAIARALHGELMIGTLGDRLVELAAGWGIVLVVSGLYLWWPRGRSGAGVLWPDGARAPAVARPACGRRLLGIGTAAVHAAQRHDMDRLLGQAIRRAVEPLSGGHVDYGAHLGPTGRCAQRRSPPNRALGPGPWKIRRCRCPVRTPSIGAITPATVLQRRRKSVCSKSRTWPTRVA